MRARRLAVGQVVKEKVDMSGLMERAFAAKRLPREATEICRARIPLRAARSKRGIGFASFLHGAGFTGSGEEYLASEVAMEAMADGTVHILAGSTEMGQGTNTIFAQIAAEALRLDCEQIRIVQPDTAYVPNSGPTVASRTAMIVGKLVETAALRLLKTLLMTAVLRATDIAPTDFSRACGAVRREARRLEIFCEV